VRLEGELEWAHGELAALEAQKAEATTALEAMGACTREVREMREARAAEHAQLEAMRAREAALGTEVSGLWRRLSTASPPPLMDCQAAGLEPGEEADEAAAAEGAELADEAGAADEAAAGAGAGAAAVVAWARSRAEADQHEELPDAEVAGSRRHFLFGAQPSPAPPAPPTGQQTNAPQGTPQGSTSQATPQGSRRTSCRGVREASSRRLYLCGGGGLGAAAGHPPFEVAMDPGLDSELEVTEADAGAEAKVETDAEPESAGAARAAAGGGLSPGLSPGMLACSSGGSEGPSDENLQCWLANCGTPPSAGGRPGESRPSSRAQGKFERDEWQRRAAARTPKSASRPASHWAGPSGGTGVPKGVPPPLTKRSSIGLAPRASEPGTCGVPTTPSAPARRAGQ